MFTDNLSCRLIPGQKLLLVASPSPDPKRNANPSIRIITEDIRKIIYSQHPGDCNVVGEMVFDGNSFTFSQKLQSVVL